MMRVIRLFYIALCLATLAAFAAPVFAQHGPPPPRPDIKPGEPTPWTRLLIEAIETAHGAEKLREHGLLEVELSFSAQDHPSFEGVLRLDTSATSRRVRLDRADGVTLLADGERWWMILDCEAEEAEEAEEVEEVADVPDAAARAEAIYHLKSLPRLVGMPFRLRDPAVRLIPSGHREVAGDRYHAVSMTFPENDDWLSIFAHRFEDRIVMISHFIRTPATVEPPVGLPPAYVVEFSDFEVSEGVTLARTWTIRRWHRVDGPVGDVIGEAKIKRVRLGEPEPALFELPASDSDTRRRIVDLTPAPPVQEPSDECADKSPNEQMKESSDEQAEAPEEP